MVASIIIIIPSGLGLLPTRPGNKHLLSTASGLGSVLGAGRTEGKTVGEDLIRPQRWAASWGTQAGLRELLGEWPG